jgi:signal transduction histidine kinase
VDPRAEPWWGRWDNLERAARAFEVLLESPLPPAGVAIHDLAGEPWRVEVRPDRAGKLVRMVPLAGPVESIRNGWLTMPVGNGTSLALACVSGPDLLPRPGGAAEWPQAAAELDGGTLMAVALGDPQAAARSTFRRVAILGGVSLTAAVLLAFAWSRQRSATRMQLELARQKDDFLATVSHELRTPVASMQLLAENLAAGAVAGADGAAVYRQRLVREAKGLASTVEHLLDFALLEQGQKAWRLAPVDTTLLAEEIRAVLDPLAAGKRIGLRLELSPIDPPPVADAEGVRRIVVNLADNAIKYSPAGSRVDIRIGPASPGCWLLRVSDEGPGIPAHEQPRVFERFFRGGGVLDRTTRGTGIGLPVARRIAEGHGGALELTASSASGTVFTCTLPLNPTPGHP